MTALIQSAAKPAPIPSKPKRITTAWLARELEKELAKDFPGDLNV